MAEAAVEAGCGLAAQRGLDIRVDRPERSLRLGVDRELAERVLQPIVENACRYGRTSVEISIGRRNGEIVYCVSDDGPGVAPAEEEHIFEPGSRGHSGRINGDGAGLGLALARRLARSVTGDVTATTTGPTGTFLVRLPAA